MSTIRVFATAGAVPSNRLHPLTIVPDAFASPPGEAWPDGGVPGIGGNPAAIEAGQARRPGRRKRRVGI